MIAVTAVLTPLPENSPSSCAICDAESAKTCPGDSSAQASQKAKEPLWVRRWWSIARYSLASPYLHRAERQP